MKSLTQHIQEAKSAASLAAHNREWTLRCDHVRRREKARNYAALLKAVAEGIGKITAELPSHRLQFSKNPAFYFTVRNPAPSGATVTAAMSSDGAALSIETQCHTNLESAPTCEVIRIGVEGDNCYFSHAGQAIGLTEAAAIILNPLL